MLGALREPDIGVDNAVESIHFGFSLKQPAILGLAAFPVIIDEPPALLSVLHALVYHQFHHDLASVRVAAGAGIGGHAHAVAG